MPLTQLVTKGWFWPDQSSVLNMIMSLGVPEGEAELGKVPRLLDIGTSNGVTLSFSMYSLHYNIYVLQFVSLSKGDKCMVLLLCPLIILIAEFQLRCRNDLIHNSVLFYVTAMHRCFLRKIYQYAH